jgi:hypothetical protein
MMTREGFLEYAGRNGRGRMSSEKAAALSLG